MLGSSENKVATSTPKLEDFGLDFSVYADFKKQKKEKSEIIELAKRKIGQLFQEKIDIRRKLFSITENFINFIIAYALIFSPAALIPHDWNPQPYLVLPLLLYLGFLGWVYGSEYNKIRNFYYDIISFGKYSKLKKEESENEKLVTKLEDVVKKNESELAEYIESTENKLRLFEESFHDYYQGQLDDFYETKLYSKRSGTEAFGQALGEFDSMIETISKANDVLITNNFELGEYENYLHNRKLDHNFQINKIQNPQFKHADDFVEEVLQASEIVSLAPEKKFRKPVKIDWENLTKERSATGMHGEEVAIALEQEYLKSINRNDLAERIRHVSKEEGDGLGYDVLSFFADGNEKFIEVKSTKKLLETPFYISRNELSFLQEHPDDAFVYRILLNAEKIDESLVEVIPSVDFLKRYELVPTQYIVKTK